MVIPDITEPAGPGPGPGPETEDVAVPATAPRTSPAGTDRFRRDAVADYAADCARYGIDRHLGLIDPMAYALEVVSRLGIPDSPTGDRT